MTPVMALGMALAGSVSAQTAAPAGIKLNTLAEIQTRQSNARLERYQLSPADHVVGGDQLVYTVEIRNTTSHPLGEVVVTNPIPEHMGYVSDSASGPGCDIDFSIDGGANYAKPEALLIALPAGQTRPAVAADYTHIRWKLRYALSGNATAFARFRATLK